MRLSDSTASQFEAAVDAIVNGDSTALHNLLRKNPDLIRARSTRAHHSTLLHYISANGVEDFRQTTPPNIIEIATILLDAGADVNAESDAYSGRSTTLMLTATSGHPENAGLQIPLLELLLDRGAITDIPGQRSTINSCLHNGRGHAAEFLASRGALLDLEGAAGVGNLDAVRRFFTPDGKLQSATQEQMDNGFLWACEFGRINMVEFLLQMGARLDARTPGQQTGLHWAACGGHVEIVKLLLDRPAPMSPAPVNARPVNARPVNAREDRWDGTPLDWALHASVNCDADAKREPWYEVAALLIGAGATLSESQAREITDPRMRAALRLAEQP